MTVLYTVAEVARLHGVSIRAILNRLVKSPIEHQYENSHGHALYTRAQADAIAAVPFRSRRKDAQQ